MTVYNVCGEEGDRSTKPKTCGFSTARTCALIHWEDTMQPWCHGDAVEEGKWLYGKASNI